jgi:membrane-associated PAP2 superfamily phosphatase
MAVTMSQHYRRRWWQVFLLFSLVFVVTELLRLKFAWAQQLYLMEGAEWSLRHHFVTETVLHDGIRQVNLIAVITLLVYAVGFSVIKPTHTPEYKHRRRRLWLLVLSLLASFALVNYLKALLGMDCPWDLSRFGGAQPSITLWQQLINPSSNGRCFPSGHSSIGFAWLAGYFFWRPYHAKRAYLALFTALFVGFALGFVQQLRGAHFFIDDITTAFVCWTVALVVFQLGEKSREAYHC